MLGLANAVLNNRPRQIRLLLNLGSNINSKNEDGKTPLMLCCDMDSETEARKMAKFLHRLGARLDFRDKRQHNVLMIAVLRNKLLLVDYLVSNCAEFDLNACDSDKNTALHLAVKLGHTDIVKLIIKAMEKFRLDLSMRNDMGLTPLVLSIINGRADVELYLRQVQSSKNVPSEHPVFVERRTVSKVTSDKPKAKYQTAKSCTHSIVNSSGVSVLRNTSLNPRQCINANIRNGKLYRNTWFSVTNCLTKLESPTGITPNRVRKKLTTHYNSKSLIAPSKLIRSQTAPANDTDEHLSTIDALDSGIAENESDNGTIQNQSSWTLPKIFDLWQCQLSASYSPSAVPKYQIDETGQDDPTGLGRADSVSSSLFPRSSSCLRGRSVMSARSVTPFADAPNPQKSDTLTLPSTKSAGRLRSDPRLSLLKVTEDHRSRSASPRPVIMVVPA